MRYNEAYISIAFIMLTVSYGRPTALGGRASPQYRRIALLAQGTNTFFRGYWIPPRAIPALSARRRMGQGAVQLQPFGQFW